MITLMGDTHRKKYKVINICYVKYLKSDEGKKRLRII